MGVCNQVEERTFLEPGEKSKNYDISNVSICIMYEHVVDYFCLQFKFKIIHVKYRK